MVEQGPRGEQDPRPETIVARKVRDALRTLQNEDPKVGDLVRNAEDFTSATPLTPWAEQEKGPIADAIANEMYTSNEEGVLETFLRTVEFYRALQALEEEDRR